MSLFCNFILDCYNMNPNLVPGSDFGPESQQTYKHMFTQLKHPTALAPTFASPDGRRTLLLLVILLAVFSHFWVVMAALRLVLMVFMISLCSKKL